ncbi:50S ribosomal protein L13 [Selenomonas ruminantium]|uniref:50S ribosomal protein L13 n=1 Tax=Selenomonas ruminantium TaxID=971 RepID=UPI0026F2A897|nr:50S ribosomal protein L13 [Selenomonas ruminantium]
MKTTFMANASNVERKWYVVDAEGQTVGRLAAEVAKVLRGKNKPTFTPHVDTGDYVIVINAEKVKFTGKKLTDKTYFRHSGYQGGTTFTSAGLMLEKFPERVIEHAVKGMLPHNRLGAKMYRKLSVYAGSEHPHAAQKPEKLELKNIR